jgi:hypothetical protein
MFHLAKVDGAGIISINPVKIRQPRGRDVGDRSILEKKHNATVNSLSVGATTVS